MAAVDRHIDLDDGSRARKHAERLHDRRAGIGKCGCECVGEHMLVLDGKHAATAKRLIGHDQTPSAGAAETGMEMVQWTPSGPST